MMLIILLTIFRLVNTRITDYSNAEFIPIPTGDAAIFEYSFYLKNSTNFSEIDAIIVDNTKIINSLEDERDREILQQDVKEIERLFRVLKTPLKIRRSIDFLGSAIKFVAEVPDHQDFEILRFQENELIRGNNRQIEINKEIENKLDEITDRINNINNINHNKITVDHQILTMLVTRRNRIIIDSLKNILYALVLAKHNIVNPLMLNIEEIELINFKENTATSIHESLLIADVKMYYQNETLVYLIKIPRVKETCKLYEIAPVVHNDKILDLKSNLTANCNENYFPLYNCKKAISYTYCKINNEDTCLSQLLNNHTANCPTTSADHLDKIQLLDEGLIIARGEILLIEQKGQRICVNGTYLVTFQDRILINGKQFDATHPSEVIQSPAPRKTILNETDFQQNVSLPYLHKLHIRNNERIEEFKATLENSKWTWYGVSGTLFLIILAILYVKIKPKTITITNTQPQAETQLDTEAIRMQVHKILNSGVQT